MAKWTAFGCDVFADGAFVATTQSKEAAENIALRCDSHDKLVEAIPACRIVIANLRSACAYYPGHPSYHEWQDDIRAAETALAEAEKGKP